MSRGGTAKALGLSSEKVARAERAGLRRLRRANRSDRCALGTVPSGISEVTRAMVAVATAPPLTSMVELAGRAGRQDLASADPDAGAVLGERASSSFDSGAGKERIPARAASALPTGGDDGFHPWPFLLLVLFLSAAALTLVLLRRGRLGPGPAGADTGGALAPPSE